MKITDYARSLQKYMTEYLPGTCGSSPATIQSYRNTFSQFLDFAESKKGIRPDKLQLRNFNYENIIEFLDWLEYELNNSVSSRNQKLAAIKSFAKFLMYEYPDYLYEFQKILSHKAKKASKPAISYAKADEYRFFLDQIDRTEKQGRRDYVIFSLMFSTGIRVSELINIKVKDISLSDPATIKVTGKGNKTRYVPIIKQIRHILENYLRESRLDLFNNGEEYLFQNKSHNHLTRQAINYLVRKYKEKANALEPGCLPQNFSPHKIRHSAAMSLLASDVNLIYIRDLLGHTSVSTTEIYAQADPTKRSKAIEEATKDLVEGSPGKWKEDKGLREFLKSLG